MRKRFCLSAGIIITVMFAAVASVSGAPEKIIKLPAPQTNGGKPLMQALKDRKTGRDFGGKKISLQTLSDMLWAAFGINRPATGGRTAPSAMNMQEIDVYAALPDGLYRYDAKQNTLILVLPEDIRAFTGGQPFVKDAPVNLIYVADLSKSGGMAEKDMDVYSAADAGFISQNVYLYCSSAGLSTVVRGYVDKPALEKKMNLRKNQKVIFAQTVGYPK